MELPYANLQIKHWNPGATNPLILPVHLICNTSDEEIYTNIRENASRPGKWVRLEKEHGKTAILCGSGPSLKEHLTEIKQKQAEGGLVFTMNGAAKFLSDNGISPDYQVIIDAREQTAELVGPAKEHLFASQVHPECFKRQPNAKVWHLQIGDIEDYFPEYNDSYCLIGGAASVGNTATCLVYAMGYRNLQIYGYDSSHRDGNGHAFRQPMNDGDPCAVVLFNGKEYTASLTMKLQAEKFQETARALIQYGCKIEVHGDGLLPDMFNTPIEHLSEKEKYERMWSYSAYRKLAPGEESVETFLDIAKPHGRVVDFGCGTGRAGVKISKTCEVLLIDFASNCRDPEAMALPFLQWDLTDALTVSGDFGYCTDVMEHIPTEDVDKVLKNIMQCVPRAFFQISTVPDNFGAAINQQLHLTVREHGFWAEKLQRYGTVLWQQNSEIASLFYVTSC